MKPPIRVIGNGWLGLFVTGNYVFAAIAGLECRKMLEKPLRVARSSSDRTCRLCGNMIPRRESFRDGGPGHLSHEDCVQSGADLFSRLEKQMKRKAARSSATKRKLGTQQPIGGAQ